jgi:hypothetical protein
MKPFTNHNDTPDIDMAPPMSGADTECLLAIQEVLEKYGKEQKFGVTLLHKHFDLTDDEIMLETQDVPQRVLTSRPVQLSRVRDQHLVATSWRFHGKQMHITGACAGGPYGGPNVSHYGYKD